MSTHPPVWIRGAYVPGRQERIRMYQQTTSYECGPYALKHALQMLGVFTDERRLAALAGTSTAGTDEVQLARAADRLGLDLPLVRTSDPAVARRMLTDQLARGVPALLCVDHWEHWIAVVGGDGERYAVLDSADPAVASAVTWERLRARWQYRDGRAAGTETTVYDIHPVMSRGATPGHAALSADAAGRLAQPDQLQLVRDWPAYSRELLALVAPAAPGNGEPTAVSLPRLLDERRGWLLTRAVGRAARDHAAAAAVLDQIRFVARTYGLRVLREKSRPVLAGVAEMVRRFVK